MDFAFLGLLVSAIWWASAVAFVIAGSFSIFVVAFVVRDVWSMIKERQQRRNGNSS